MSTAAQTDLAETSFGAPPKLFRSIGMQKWWQTIEYMMTNEMTRCLVAKYPVYKLSDDPWEHQLEAVWSFCLFRQEEDFNAVTALVPAEHSTEALDWVEGNPQEWSNSMALPILDQEL
jgi:hypothetical protein